MNPFQAWRTTVGGVPAGLQMPIFLFVAAAIAAVTFWLARQVFRRTLTPGWVAPRLAARLVPGRAPRREAAKVALVGGGLALLAVACARPYWGQVNETVHRRGADVVVALDASRSMLSHDVNPDRLTQARVAVESLIDQLHGDRVGVVAFAKDAFVQAPLTTDYAAARLYLRAIDPLQMQQGGTDVGGALRESGELLARAKHGPRAQAVVLLTDGEDWGESASREAKALGDAGVQVFTVAVGTEAGGPVPTLDAHGRVNGEERDASGAVILSRANRTALAALAAEAHGQSFDLANDLGVHALGQALDQLKKGEIEELTVSAAAERFAWFALPAFALLLLGLWLSPTGSRKSALGAAALAALALAAFPSQARADVFHVPEPATQAGAQAYAAGHFDVALKKFQGAKSDAVSRFDQGDALAALGRTDDALKTFSTPAPALRGRDAYNLGTLQAKGEHKPEAIASLRQALVADPSNEDARHNLEVLLAEQQKKDPQKKDDPKQSKDDKKQGKNDKPQPKDGDQKDQQAKNGDGKDQQQPQAKNSDGKDQQQPQPGQPEKGTDPYQQPQGAPGADGQLAQSGDKPATPSERMLDALKAGDRLMPYHPNTQPERSTPDAHPW